MVSREKHGLDVTNLPLADKGFHSFRYKGRYGYIMIGAKSYSDALREASRSSTDPVSMDNLESWNGQKYTHEYVKIQTEY